MNNAAVATAIEVLEWIEQTDADVCIPQTLTLLRKRANLMEADKKFAGHGDWLTYLASLSATEVGIARTLSHKIQRMSHFDVSAGEFVEELSHLYPMITKARLTEIVSNVLYHEGY